MPSAPLDKWLLDWYGHAMRRMVAYVVGVALVAAVPAAL